MSSVKQQFSSYEKFIVIVLTFLQFTIILDFMILAPLGAFLMPALKIDTAQFGLVVSAYAVSSAISGFLAAGFADKFDRKKLLLFFYTGFIIGTLLCGLAADFKFLLFARIVTGLFGGVIGSIVFAITTDLFPLEKRGRVIGLLQTAFAASQILGLPAGLFLTNHWGWHMPFFMIVGISIIAAIIIKIYMQPVRDHLDLQTDKKAYLHLIHTLQVPFYLLAFLTTGLLSLGGFMIMPFSTAFTVNNMGIHADHLPLIYLVTGTASILIGPLVGKLSDSYGKIQIFIFGSLVSLIMVLTYTSLGITPLWLALLINTVMFVGMFSRMIPSQALMSAIPSPANRGSFMSVSSSLQSLAGGIGAIAAGAIVTQDDTGKILHFEQVGYIISIITLFCVVFMVYINRKVTNSVK